MSPWLFINAIYLDYAIIVPNSLIEIKGLKEDVGIKVA